MSLSSGTRCAWGEERAAPLPCVALNLLSQQKLVQAGLDGEQDSGESGLHMLAAGLCPGF